MLSLNRYLLKWFCFCILKYIVIFIEKKIFFIFQNKLKIVQTLVKWLFWTSINLDIILAEVFGSITCLEQHPPPPPPPPPYHLIHL